MTRESFQSLKHALLAFGVPTENHALVEQVCERIGVSRWLPYSDHFRAVRTSEGPDLRVHWGWTEGFVNEEEVLMATDGRWTYVQSDHLGAGMYYVEHPINRLHEGGGGAPGKHEPLAQVCPVHHVALPSTGLCDDCA